MLARHLSTSFILKTFSTCRLCISHTRWYLNTKVDTIIVDEQHIFEAERKWALKFDHHFMHSSCCTLFNPIVTPQLNLNMELEWLHNGLFPTSPPHPTQPPHETPCCCCAADQEPSRLIFGMQPYFDPTRKTTLKKMEDDLKKKWKWKTT